MNKLRILCVARRMYEVKIRRRFTVETLSQRSLLRIEGEDRGSLLQGLLTNDIQGLAEKKSIYSFLLSAKGRVLFDVIIYNNLDGTLLLECDQEVSARLMKHLGLYKIRKQVNISKVESAQVSIILPESPSENIESLKIHESNKDLVYFGSDPRLKSWVVRVVTVAGLAVECFLPSVRRSLSNRYLESRHRLGICEGVVDFGFDSALPLEHNGDIINGISFNKGCYLGQELTARTHHTGVVRKRVMPVIVEDIANDVVPEHILAKDRTLFSDKDMTVSAGTMKSMDKSGAGLALVRLSSLVFDKVLADGSTQFCPLFLGSKGSCTVTVLAPAWWPREVILPSAFI